MMNLLIKYNWCLYAARRSGQGVQNSVKNKFYELIFKTMLGDIVGYVLPKKDAKGQTPDDISKFQGVPCRVFEINHASKSVLAVSPDGESLGMFDLDQIERLFECQSFSGLLIPKGLNEMQALIYVGRVFSHPQNSKRDMNFIRKLVIVASLAKGEFCDTLYFNFSS